MKLVYCGPALSGKTTNLKSLHKMLGERVGSELISLETKDDRTLFFDLMPIALRVDGGAAIKIKLFTVPGQVIHNETRKLVLQGADGVVFIADSRISQTRMNNESFANMKRNLRENAIDPNNTAMAIQFNKRDLPDIRTSDEVRRIAAKGKEPVFSAVALDGDGVFETFMGVAELSLRRLEAAHGLQRNFGIVTENVMSELHTLFS